MIILLFKWNRVSYNGYGEVIDGYFSGLPKIIEGK